MNIPTWSPRGVAAVATLSIALLPACPGGGDNPLGDLAAQCGLVCPIEGLAEGNASISGVASVDAFFSSVIGVRDTAASVSASVRAELLGLAALLEIEGAADMSMDELTAAVEGGLQAMFDLYVDGGLTINFQPPRCEASIEASVDAAAECDVEADPGMIEASCEGSCEVSAEVAAQCQAEGALSCEGQAPGFQCEGSCSGSCQLEAAAGCEGTCNGSCEGQCSACAGGDCEQDGNGVTTNCAGSCSSGCSGECKLEAGGTCTGRCEGSCTYDAPEAGCEANASAVCDASAMAEVECEGECRGNVEPPMVSAECQASVEAKAKASAECHPPSLSVDFQFLGGLTADSKAEFKAFLEGFKLRFAALLAAKAKLEIVGEAIIDLGVAATGSVTGAVEAASDAAAGGDLKIAIGLTCALDELPNVEIALTDASTDLEASVSAVASVTAAVGG